MLPLHFVTVSICSVYTNRSKKLLKLNDVTPAINSKKKHEKCAVVTYEHPLKDAELGRFT